jgi:DNA polymerase
MQDFISIDFETRSTVDLKKAGVYVYADHPDTDVWCMAYAIGDEEPQIWVPGDPVPDKIWEACDRFLDFRAWNANFERIIWEEQLAFFHHFPKLPPEYWVDTAAEAAAMALPRALGQAARVLGLKEQKDVAGHRLMMQMARPRTKDPLTWWDDSERFRRLIQYCKKDVEAAGPGRRGDRASERPDP